MKIHGLILAAGRSSRLGQPKQLINFNGLSLLQHTEKLINPHVSQLYVVLGYQHKTIQKELRSAKTVVNNQWQLGMGTSISCGLKSAEKTADAILIALCDQPLIPEFHYQKLSHYAKQNPNKIITTSYAKTLGVPAIFPQSYFSELKNLHSEKGAQPLLIKHRQQVVSVNCEAATSDIDTPDQLSDL